MHIFILCGSAYDLQLAVLWPVNCIMYCGVRRTFMGYKLFLVKAYLSAHYILDIPIDNKAVGSGLDVNN